MSVRLARVGVQHEAAFVVAHAEHGYTANLPLADATRDRSGEVYRAGADTEPTTAARWPPRPAHHFWKSARWQPDLGSSGRPATHGFWEHNGATTTATVTRWGDTCRFCEPRPGPRS